MTTRILTAMFLARPDARTLVVLASEADAASLEGAGALSALDGPGTHWLASSEAVRQAAGFGSRVGVDLGVCSRKLDTIGRYARLRWLALYGRRSRSRQLAADQRLRPMLDWRGERRLTPVPGVSVEGRLRVRVSRPELLGVAASGLVRPALSFALLRGVPVDPRVEAAFSAARFDLVVVPVASARDLVSDVFRVARRLGVVSLAVVVRLGGEDGEEGLGVRPVEEALAAVPPDHVAVWGPHTRELLVRVHGFAPEAVVAVGAPGFDGPSASSRAPAAAISSRAPAAPTSSRAPAAPTSSRAPAGLPTSGIEGGGMGGAGGPRVVVVGADPGLVPDVRAAVGGFAVVEDAVDGARPRLHDAAVVCTPRGDVVLEAAALGRRTAILDVGDAREARRGRAGPADYARWQGIEKLRGVRLCRELSDLTRWLTALESWPEPDPVELAYWIHRDERRYAERLAAVVDDLCHARHAS
jgi:hypothetical protein